MKYLIQNKKLIIDDKVINFQWPIDKVEIFENVSVIVVLIDYYHNFYKDQNIFGVSFEGKILWQIEKIKHLRGDSPYTNIAREDDGTLYACNWDGTDLWLDPKTGKILKEGYSK